MPATAWLTPATVADDSSRGLVPWNSHSNATSDNAAYATSGQVLPFSQVIKSGSVRLVKGGTIQGDDLASTNQTQIVKLLDTDITFGSTTQLWGLNLSWADVNASNFGFVWADDQNSYYLKATNFSSTVPAGAFIEGIEVSVQAKQNDNGFSYSFPVVDVMRMRIHYRTDFEISIGGQSSGLVWGTVPDNLLSDKLFQFKVYDEGVFLGEWKDIASDPEFKEQINTIGTTMPIKLGRAIDTVNNMPQQFTDESSDDFLYEDGDTVIGYAGAGAALGADSDADVNYDLQVNAFYGGYDYLVTQDLEELVTQDYELLYVTDGAPEGRALITGFLSKWKAGYGGDEAVGMDLMTYGWELNNTMLETAGQVVLDLDWNDFYNSFGQYNNTTGVKLLRQTFTAPSTGLLSRVIIPAAEVGYYQDTFKYGPVPVTVTLNIYAGTAHSGTPLATTSQVIYSNSDEWTTPEEMIFALGDYITLTSGSTYSLVFSSSHHNHALNASDELNVLFGTADAYSGGACTYVLGNGTTSSPAFDIAFALEYTGGLTTRTFNSTDPSDIMRAIVDFAASKGAHIGYNDDSIEDTGTTVSYTFKTNTVAEAINKTLELAPSDWYYYIDPAENILYFKPRPSTPDHTFTLGKDIASFELERDMEGIVNEAYFSGAGDPALFVKRVDQDSQDDWRRGVTKLSDNRVSVQASAETIADGYIERNKEPLYRARIVIAAASYDIETIKVGHLAALRGFGNFVDDLELQISAKQYSPDTVTLEAGTLRPEVTKRLEDLRRNLDVLEQQNNPTAPA